MVLITLTEYVTVTPTPTLPPSTVIPGILLISIRATPITTSLLTFSSNTPIPTITPSPHPTTNASLPLEFAPPAHQTPKANNALLIILLVFVIVLATLFCSLIGYVIYLRAKGKCLTCEDLKTQLGKWESGELKRITREMVRRREEVNREDAGAEERDLETGEGRGWSVVHQETLDRLEGREHVGFWDRLFMSEKKRGKMPAREVEVEEVEQAESSSVASDRFFVVVDAPSSQRAGEASHVSRTQPNLDGNHHSLWRPASSVYSQPTVVDQGPWSFREHHAADMPPIDEDHPARYQVQRPPQAALYAGGNSYTFEDEDDEQASRVSAASSYKPPAWRLNKRFSDRGR